MKNLLKTLKELFAKLFNWGQIDNKSSSQQDSTFDMTNRKLMSDLVDLFERGIQKESVGERMLYPMSFYVLMHKDDYEDRKKALPILVPEIIKAFYKVIQDNRVVYPNCDPVSKKWVFQFSPCQFDSSIETEDKDEFTVKKGNIVSSADLYNDSIDTFQDMLVERNIKVSIKCNNSNVIKTANLNLKAIAGVDILGEGFFTYKFDDKIVNPLEKDPVSISFPEPEIIEGDQPLATISYVYNSKTYTYTMRVSPLYVSSKKDKRTTSNILRVEGADIENGHVQIKYENGKFFICTFGDTRLNEKKLEVSDPNNIKWKELSNKSDILMNGEFQIRFQKI